ncbi:MAG: NAD-dependent epimerase/dehydratase family protein [Paracoccus sp. (in: a-proteobacteria)]|nr:NAD-dependent epimerase/dehydratase family protein [Paracoccus sp. (in: a-proteobacteria)]
MPIACVTGATGCLGQALCADLAREGWEIRSLSRHATPPETPVARHDALDLGRDPLPEAALRGVDVVFHCAALSSAWGAAEEFHSANVTATERLLDAARAAGVARFVFASTPSLYITGKPRLDLAEDAALPTRFLTEYARTKYIAETIVRAANSQDFTTVALRPRAIYGRHDRALLPRLLAALERGAGRLTIPGDGQALIDPTHASDAARAMRLAALADAGVIGGRAYNITSGQAVTVHDLLDRLEVSLNRKIARRSIPYAAAMAAAGMAETMQRLRNPAAEPGVTRHAVAALGLSLTLDIGAARRDLGYVPQVDLAKGLAGLSPPPAHKAVLPARADDGAIRLQMLRVGDCLTAGTALRRDALPLPHVVPALVAVLDHGGGDISLFDAGYGRLWPGITRALPEIGYRLVVPSRLPKRQQLDVSLRRLGVGAVSRVVFSHLHADHVAGLFDLDRVPPCLASHEALSALQDIPDGPGALSDRIAAMRAALPLALARQLRDLARTGRLSAIEAAPLVSLPGLLGGLGPGHDLTGDGSVIALPLPGHGRGQIGLWLPRTSRGAVLLAGDAAFSGAALRDRVMPPVAVVSRLGDPAAYLRTFGMLARLVSEGVEVITSHDPHVRTA